MRGTVPFRRVAAATTVKAARRRQASWLTLGLTLCAASGCASTSHADLMAFLRAHQHTVATGHYTVMPPDAILIHAPVAAEVDGAVATLRPDGKVALRLVGEVDVAGLTTDQIADKLRGLLARYYVDPEVVVDVARYASQCYYVFGQVAAPGPKPFTGRDTLLKALAEARPTFLAWRERVHVVRPTGQEGQSRTIVVNLAEMVRTGDVRQNVLLQPGDIIEVPPTPLAWVGLRVRELLYPVDPILNAYQAPASAIHSTRIYEDEFGSGGGSDGRRHPMRR